MKPISGCLTVIIVLFSTLCVIKGGEMVERTTYYKSISDVPASAWEKLAQKKIYFGHQSVGFNIMNGINDLLGKNPQIKLNIIETTDKDNLNSGDFAHSRAGKNRDPESKINAFVKFMEDGLGNNVDIAFFKFCFVDFNSDTVADKLFNSYRDSMSQLKNTFDKTTFIHVTVPLTTDPPGLKKWIFKIKLLIKKVLGKPVFDITTRSNFNENMRNEYKGKAPFFDLAEIESTFSNGNHCTITKGGTTTLSLVPEYTYDGGHLNEKGRKRVAQQLLLLLVSQP